MAVIPVCTPLTEDCIERLRAGDRVQISGVVYTARDAAHKRMIEQLEQGLPLPFDMRGQILYYTGPAPARPGRVIGSAGPTTSGRMDRYTPKLLECGLKGMIGKGYRSPEVKEAIVRHRAVYFAAVGGSGALLAQAVQSQEVIAYEDLGPEAVRRLVVKQLPVIVINDMYGGDLYVEGTSRYRQADPPD
jgi:fumarate hydratase subunit beta